MISLSFICCLNVSTKSKRNLVDINLFVFQRLLFAHKQQLEQEVKLRQLSCNEADRLDRDIIDCGKQSKDINSRIDRLQCNLNIISAT